MPYIHKLQRHLEDKAKLKKIEKSYQQTC